MYDCVKEEWHSLNHWPKPVVFVSMDIMYLFDDSKKFKLVCVKNGDSIEFKASRNENVLEGILNRGTHYNWIAFPSLQISCQLADFNDIYWNAEQLSDIFDNDFDVDTVLMIIKEAKDLFNQDHQSYSDGHKFMSIHEYIFWLENQCEVLSYQLIKLQAQAERLLHRNLQDELEEERKEFHDTMRFQYDDAIFE